VTRVAFAHDVEAERLALADLLDTLSDPEWSVRSLCAGWSVREVVAHLTLANREFAATVLRLVRARGDFDRVTAEMARERAVRFSPAELVAQLRESAGEMRRFPMSGPLDPLTDILVHGQDIARPLGRHHPMRPDLAGEVLQHVWKSFFYGARKRFAGLRFVATDVDGSVGDGAQEVHGPAGALLLIVTGRAAGLTDLTGDGVVEATARLAPSASAPGLSAGH
jgi:uncharacterized protein (TIGR03083 family)